MSEEIRNPEDIAADVRLLISRYGIGPFGPHSNWSFLAGVEYGLILAGIRGEEPIRKAWTESYAAALQPSPTHIHA